MIRPLAPTALLLFAAALAGCSSRPLAGPQGAPPVLASQELDVVQDIATFHLTFTGTVSSEEAATVERAKWEMVVDGEVKQSGEEPVGAQVAPGGTASFEVKVKTQYVSSPEELQAMNERGGSLLTALRGTLHVRSGGRTHELEFGRAREVRTPRLPSVKMQSLDAARYSDDEANLIFYLGIVNPNPFFMSVNGLDYKITVAGKELGSGTRARADKVTPSATGVYEIQHSITPATLQMDAKEVRALIKRGQLPWMVEGQLRADLFAIPYKLEGVVQLPPPSR
jgi:LEA14-like dessication related protein